MSSAVETPLFFANGTRQLFGIVHDPHGPARTPFVFCHPFGEEKLWAHRVYVNFARQLASMGHPVLRFDYAGNGDSSGAFVESTVQSALADVGAAIELMKARLGSSAVALLGLRFGASVAAMVAARRDDVERLVLWAPIANGERYVQELLRINLTTQMAVFKEIRSDREALVAALRRGESVNVDGYELSPEMHDELSQMTLDGLPVNAAEGCLIVQIERAPSVPRVADLAALTNKWPNCAFSLVQEEPFWKEIKAFYDTAPKLFECTRAWISQPVSTT